MALQWTISHSKLKMIAKAVLSNSFLQKRGLSIERHFAWRLSMIDFPNKNPKSPFCEVCHGHGCEDNDSGTDASKRTDCRFCDATGIKPGYINIGDE